MMNLSMAQALSLWSDLEQALHGTHGFGGHVAEIYMYRLMPYQPSVAMADGLGRDQAPSWMGERKKEAYAQANQTLHELLYHFKEQRQATIKIEGIPLEQWDCLAYTTLFDYRVHVEVTP